MAAATRAHPAPEDHKPSRGGSDKQVGAFGLWPLPGDEGFPEFTLKSYDAGHLLDAEVRGRNALHELIVRAAAA